MDENNTEINDSFELDLPSAGLGALAFAALGGLACGAVWCSKKIIAKIKEKKQNTVEVEPAKKTESK